MPISSGRTDFPTTRWTLVAAAGDRNRADSRQALGIFVRGLLVRTLRDRTIEPRRD